MAVILDLYVKMNPVYVGTRQEPGSGGLWEKDTRFGGNKT
jgi:hypothetical protein